MMAHGSIVAFAPGRVNLLGEHTDYAGGLALPFAIDRGVTVRATPLPGPLTMAVARDLGETDAFDAWRPGPTTGWRAFVRGTVAELDARPARIEIGGNLPRGGGLASSAALGCALALALCGCEDPDRRALARLASRVENEWVGARTGLLDQYASLLAREGHALRIDFTADTVEPVPLELGGWRLAVAAAGARDLATAGYNDVRAEPDGAHVTSENARVRAFTGVETLGPLLDESHASLRDDLGVSTERVEAVVTAMKGAGATGARLIGGGFGGHVLALFAPDVPLPRGTREVRPSAGAYILGPARRQPG
ncbi:MAG: galactokinase family protein [Solirubrobacteraceae bacterium]